MQRRKCSWAVVRLWRIPEGKAAAAREPAASSPAQAACRSPARLRRRRGCREPASGPTVSARANAAAKPGVEGLRARAMARRGRRVHGIEVHGIEVDAQTRCRHYHAQSDVVAIKFKCCGAYYSCYRCHEALADHPARPWPRADFSAEAILCGACGGELGIREYLACGASCPRCGARFNPRCEKHFSAYFL